MHPLIQKLLRKRGIKDTVELTSDEKIIFEDWQKILSKEELNLEDVKSFCQTQIDTIESRWKDYNIDSTKKAELIPYHTVYKSILLAMQSPRSARESLEKQLNQLLCH